MNLKNKETIEKDKSHISWKNHGIDQYIKDALKEYIKLKEVKKWQ